MSWLLYPEREPRDWGLALALTQEQCQRWDHQPCCAAVPAASLSRHTGSSPLHLGPPEPCWLRNKSSSLALCAGLVPGSDWLP